MPSKSLVAYTVPPFYGGIITTILRNKYISDF